MTLKAKIIIGGILLLIISFAVEFSMNGLSDFPFLAKMIEKEKPIDEEFMKMLSDENINDDSCIQATTSMYISSASAVWFKKGGSR